MTRYFPSFLNKSNLFFQLIEKPYQGGVDVRWPGVATDDQETWRFRPAGAATHPPARPAARNDMRRHGCCCRHLQFR